VGYIGGSIASAVSMPVIGIVAIGLSIVLSLVELAAKHSLAVSWQLSSKRDLSIPIAAASVIVLALVFWLFARFCLTSTQNWIAQRERIRYWEPENRRPPRVLRRRMALPR
jgi:hypothetical protein